MTSTKEIFRPFTVHIPSIVGDGSSGTIRIQIPVQVDPDSGEETITPEGFELIEEVKADYRVSALLDTRLAYPGEIVELGVLSAAEMSTLNYAYALNGSSLRWTR